MASPYEGYSVREWDRITAGLIAEHPLSEEEIEKKIHEIVDEINRNSPQTRQIASLRIRNTPFPRTSSGKIKRTEFYFSAEEKR